MTTDLPLLLAEDDEGQATLVRRNLQRADVVADVARVRDGQEALDYVRRQGDFARRAAGGPVVLVVDIHMPRVDGVEVLHQVKADPATARLPVIMLTTTDDPREVERCYRLGCSAYITKPVQYDQFVEVVRRLGQFLDIVSVPGENG
jgi:CheY-like chemotaxis protein